MTRQIDSGGVARGVEDLQVDLAEAQVLAVVQGVGVEVECGGGAVGDAGAGAFGQFQVAGEEVGVDVGLDDALDGQAVALGGGEVVVDVAPGVDHDGPAGGAVADEVRGVGEAVEVEPHEDQRSGVVRHEGLLGMGDARTRTSAGAGARRAGRRAAA
nr:hypothetical protein [Streptomyces sudanensis]